MTYTGTAHVLCLYFVTTSMIIRDVYVCMSVPCKATCGSTIYVRLYGIAFVKVHIELCNTEKMLTRNAILDASLNTKELS